MSRCEICHQDGLYFAEHVDPDGYVVLACQCQLGGRWRVKHQLRAFASRLEPQPIWVGRIEEFFTEAELKTLKPVEREHQIKGSREQVGRSSP